MPDAAPLELPRLSDDDLILVSVLGEGATAHVFRAWMADAGQWCAVKVMKEGKPTRLRQRFLDEARLLRALSHRNLIKVLRIVDGPPPWFVMEIADGGSLRDWCARFGKMPPRLAVDAAIQICKGVAVAHQGGVVHRDIKPHNVLINRSGACKLTDFGIARMRRKVLDAGGEDPSLAGDALGTLGYMAPEQQSDPSAVDEGADIYAIGATLFHLLIGDTPPGNLFMATREYPELFQGIPDVLVPVIQKATAYKRADRHATAMDLARELHATWEFLPPLTRENPTLTTGIPLEPAPPPGMTKRTPNTSPSVDRSVLPALDVFAPSAVADNSAPSLPPTPDLRRQLPPVPAEVAPGTRWWLVGILAATLLFALFSLDVLWVAVARRECFGAQAVFVEVARANAAVIDELATLGADRAALAATYDAVRTGSARERHAAARTWVDALGTATEAHHADPRLATVVRSRQEALAGALAPWSLALETWEHRATTLPGSLVSPIVGGPDTAGGGGR